MAPSPPESYNPCHADTADELIAKGPEIERGDLARAVRLPLERRVLINGGRTVFFEE